MKKKKWIIITLVALTIFRILLALKLPVGIFENQVYDDQLLYKYAISLKNFDWLGAYNQLTLVKGISFSVFLVFCSICYIPYKLGLILLYILSIMAFCRALKPKFEDKYLYIIYLLLLYSPVMFTTLISQRMYRNAILPSTTLLVFGCYIGLYFRKDKSIKEILPWIISSIFSLIFFWHVKEDSIWILPFICTISALIIIYWIINKKEKILKRIVILLLPFICLISFNQIYSFVNYKVYGVYTVSDKNGGNFSGMIKRLFMIKPKKEKEGVWLTKDMLNQAYEASPTFSKLKNYMTIFTGWTTDEGEVGGDLIIWKIRYVMSLESLYEDGKTADDFCKQVNKELDAAFKNGKLKKDKKIHISAQMKGITFEDIQESVSTQFDWYNEMSVYKRNRIDFTYSMGDGVTEIADMTQTNPMFVGNEYDDSAIKLSNGIISIYKTLSPIINIIAYISFIYMILITVVQLIKRNYVNIDVSIVTIGIALCILLVLTEVALFLSYLEEATQINFRDFYCAHAFPLIQMFKYISIAFGVQQLIFKFNNKKEGKKMKNKKKKKQEKGLNELISLILKFDFNNLFRTKTDNTFIQFFRYLFVGGFAAVVNIGMLYVFTDIVKIYYVISNILAFILGLLVNYILSKKFVFQDDVSINKSKEFIIYAIIGIIGLGIDTLFVWLFTDIASIYYIISKIISTGIVFIWNFGARKVLYKVIK